MMGTMNNYEWLLQTKIAWTRTGNPKFPFRAQHGALRLELYSGDWPSENPYTLYVDGTPAFGIGDLPATWSIPE